MQKLIKSKLILSNCEIYNFWAISYIFHETCQDNILLVFRNIEILMLLTNTTNKFRYLVDKYIHDRYTYDQSSFIYLLVQSIISLNKNWSNFRNKPNARLDLSFFDILNCLACKVAYNVSLKELPADIKGRILTEMNKPYRFIRDNKIMWLDTAGKLKQNRILLFGT